MKPVSINRQGVQLLRPGRRYRMTIAVEGAMLDGQLEGVLERIGFCDLGLTWPDDWPAQRPADWPEEPRTTFPYPVGMVRASADLWPPNGGAGVRFEPEIELGAGSFTLVRAWDCGPAWGRPEALEPVESFDEEGDFYKVGADAPASMPTGLKVAIGGAVVLAAWAVYSSTQEEKRIESDALKYAELAARAEHARTGARAAELERGGMTATDAHAVAELEAIEKDDQEAQIIAAIAAQG